MKQGESSRNAYIFVSISLLLQFAFLLSSSQSLRVVDEAQRNYLNLLNDWYSLRLATVDDSYEQTFREAVTLFDAHLEALLGSEAIEASTRLSTELGQVVRRIRESWQRAEPLLTHAEATGEESVRVLAATLLNQVGRRLADLDDPIGEMVRGQRRALRVVLYVLSATILATIGIFFLIERESIKARAAAMQIKSLAQSTIGTQEQERARIARALHDSLAQELSLLLLYLGEDATELSAETSREMRSRLVRSVAWLRNLAYELHPAEIEEVGLPVALASYCEEIVVRHGAPVQCEADETIDFLPDHVAINIYRMAQEAVTNAIRHGNASRISVSLLDLPERILLTVEDDGVGFRTDGERTLGDVRGLGLVGMRERANIVGGNLLLNSAPGAGTRVEFFLPKETLRDEERSVDANDIGHSG
jgi:signal transduction histidine kinase